MGKVGAMSTQDHADPDPKPDPKPAPAPEAPKPDDVAAGNIPVDRQETQAERDARRPIDQA